MFLRVIDDFLNAITMYRLVVYGLILLFCVGLLYSFFGLLAFTPFAILLSLVLLLVSCYVTNSIFSKIFKAPTNVESWIITSFILFFIFTPANSPTDYLFLSLCGFIAMASKYILAINRKHIFNPAAISAVISGFLGFGASWWVGSSIFAPVTVIIGLLIVRKIRRFRLFFSFVITATITILAFGLVNKLPIFDLTIQIFTSWPLWFFATIMLTEPLTTPPTRRLQTLYGILVGLLFGSPLTFGFVSTTPEFALVVGNLFSFLLSPHTKLILTLKEKISIARNLYEFSFISNQKLDFLPGQYLEWTLPHKSVDSRGNRRYFTIASSPTEENIKLGVKIFENSSSFKTALMSLDKGTRLTASQLSGDFTLPKDSNKKLVFIAGGIGVTPFRSMIKYLLDKSEKRDIVLFYINKTAEEIVFKEIFDEAFRKLDIKTVYVLTDKENIPKGWKGRVGHLGGDIIRKDVFDFRERIFYISGSHSMTESLKEILKGIEVSDNQIKTDYFPGYA